MISDMIAVYQTDLVVLMHESELLRLVDQFHLSSGFFRFGGR